jgi:FAD/FMN-containing dehydrogenase
MTTTDTTELRQSFTAGFSGDAIPAGSPGYEAARAVWNGSVDLHPAVIAQCRTTADVVAAVRLAREAGVPLAVRGGGHSVSGASSCDGGVVVDLSTMRGVTVDAVRRVAVVEGGATWADVDAATGVHGLATTGGLISTTGVAGLTLGGGLGWLQRRYGLSCDNLRGAEVVTADGHVIPTSGSERPELLWGLRGGGGNFGVVTSFEFDLHPVSTILGGLLMFPLDRGVEVLTTFREWAPDAPDDASLLAGIMTAPPAPFVPPELTGQKVVVLVGCWCGDHAEGVASLAPLRALGPAVDLFGPMPYPALQGMLDAGAPPGIRNYFRGGFVADLTDEIISVVLDHGARLPSPMAQIHFHQMGGAVGRVPEDASAVNGRAAGYTFNLISTWTDPGEDAVHLEANHALSAALGPLSMGTTYLNFAVETGIDRVRAAYGEAIYGRLARLKREYDPTNLFRRNHNVRPAP